MRHAFAALPLTLALAAPRPLHAQPRGDLDAESSYAEGLRALRARRFEDAARAFEGSYRAAPVPAVLYNLALAYRGAGRHGAALEAFTRYLRDEADAVPRARRAAVTQAIDDLRARVASIECRVDPAAVVVTLDGAPCSCALPVLVDPGAHHLEARAAGYVAERRTVTLSPGERVSLTLRLTAEPAPLPAPAAAEPTTEPPRRVEAPASYRTVVPPVPAPEAPAPWYARGWFWAALGGAVALAAGLAIVFVSERRDPALDGALFRVEAIGAP